MRLLVAIAVFVLGCSPETIVEPADVGEPVHEAQSDGYCTDYTLPQCTPNDAAARQICMGLYGETFATAVECWQSDEALDWGCLQATGYQIICPGAEESPSDLYCCDY